MQIEGVKEHHVETYRVNCFVFSFVLFLKNLENESLTFMVFFMNAAIIGCEESYIFLTISFLENVKRKKTLKIVIYIYLIIL